MHAPILSDYPNGLGPDQNDTGRAGRRLVKDSPVTPKGQMTLRAGIFFVTICFAASGLLAGCGFRPLYSSSSGVASALSSVQVETSEGRPAYLLGVALLDRLGSWQGEETRYVLRTSTSLTQNSTSLTIDQVASRILMSASVNYALYDRATGARVTGGSVLGQASYDVPAAPYAAIRAEQDAAERATQDAADRLAVALAQYLREAESQQTAAVGN